MQLVLWKSALRTAWALAAVSLFAVVGARAASVDAAPLLQLRWEVQRTVFTPESPQGRSVASMTLTNKGPQALPAQGWAVYFNCVAGVDMAPVGGPFTIERLSGTWYRFRPNADFTGLALGQATQLLVIHPEVMVKTAKAPVGPYIVFDAHPKSGYSIKDYETVPFTRTEQWDHGPKDLTPLITAELTYERNASISNLPIDSLPPVFPTPHTLEYRLGTLRWSSMPAIVAGPGLDREVALAKSILKPHLRDRTSSDPQPGIRLAIINSKEPSSPESYQLSIDPVKGVTLTGQTAQAVAWGLQSLRELLPIPTTDRQGVTLKAMHIEDAPRFAYRGFQLDVARNFQPKEQVFRLLDLMARYKLNKFHFHLTDDEGWRLEIPGLPELTQVGARRGHALTTAEHLQPAYGSGPDVRDPYGSGFYSSVDYIEIVKYAAQRHIEVIPEIEMPGHARAAVKAMESRYQRLTKSRSPHAGQFLLNDPQDQSVYKSAQLYTDHLMNPGLASTYTFVQHVVSEVAQLHRKAGVPLRTLHVGADELPNGAWEKSPATHALMQREGLATTADVWDYFYKRVDAMLRKQGLAASGWEELGARKVKLRGADKLIPNPAFVGRGFTLYVWNNLDDAEDLAYRMANAGYRTVLAPATHLYFDMAYNKNPDEPGVNWAAYTDLDTVFSFVPFNFVRTPGRDGLTDYGQQNIVGLEGTLFSETVRSSELMDYLLMPRMLALAERAWAADPAWAQEADQAKAQPLYSHAWSVFANQLGKVVLPKLNAELTGVLYLIPPPGLKVENQQVRVNHQTPGVILRYTTDGAQPTTASAIVHGPLTEKAIITVAAFDSVGRKGRISRIDNR
jgi:hexosaminidase